MRRTRIFFLLINWTGKIYNYIPRMVDFSGRMCYHYYIERCLKMKKKLISLLLTALFVMSPLFGTAAFASSEFTYSADPAKWTVPWAETQAEYDKCDVLENTVAAKYHYTTDCDNYAHTKLAMDVAGDTGVSIYSPCSGRIVFAGCAIANRPASWYMGNYDDTAVWGNFVVIEYNESGDRVLLAQLSSVSSALRVNYQIEAGDYIGKMGSTGAINSVQLHFELMDVESEGLNNNYVLCGRTLGDWKNQYKNVTLPTSAACVHSFTVKSVSATHTSKGHRVYYYCSKCGANDGILHNEWATRSDCPECYVTPPVTLVPYITSVACLNSKLYTGDTANLYIRTNSAVYNLALIGENGAVMATATAPDTYAGDVKEWSIDWNVGNKTGARNLTIRAYSGNRYVDRKLSITVYSSAIVDPSVPGSSDILSVTNDNKTIVLTGTSVTFTIRTGSAVKRLTLVNEMSKVVGYANSYTNENAYGRYWTIKWISDTVGTRRLMVRAYTSTAAAASPTDTKNVTLAVVNKLPDTTLAPNITGVSVTAPVYGANIMAGDTVSIKVSTNAVVKRVALIGENGAVEASTDYSRVAGTDAREWTMTWKPLYAGNRTLWVRAYDAKGNYDDYRLDIAVISDTYAPPASSDETKVTNYQTIGQREAASAYPAALYAYLRWDAHGCCYLHIIANSKATKVGVSHMYGASYETSTSYSEAGSGMRDFGEWEISAEGETIKYVRVYDAYGNHDDCVVTMYPEK